MENTDEEWKDAGVNKICGELNLQDRHVSGGNKLCNLNKGLEKVESESHSNEKVRERKRMGEGRRKGSLWGKWMHHRGKKFCRSLSLLWPFQFFI